MSPMGYYAEKLAGERLRRCYEIAPARVQAYLEAEIRHVRSRLRPRDRVLELGCGYGRAAFGLVGAAERIVGIDSALESIELAGELVGDLVGQAEGELAGQPEGTPAGAGARCLFAAMDALRLGFRAGSFDVVVCIQNGICAFRADPAALVREALRVVRPGGRVLLSSYAEAFWSHRLEWFELQSAHGLLGEIDREATRDGTIVCRDGFRSGTFVEADFRALGRDLGLAPRLVEIDRSSLFCEFTRPANGASPG